jgi:hypothetical protein
MLSPIEPEQVLGDVITVVLCNDYELRHGRLLSDDRCLAPSGVKGSERVKRLCFLKENVPLSLPATKLTQTRNIGS